MLRLHSLFDEPGAQAAGADPDSPVSAIGQGSDRLEVRIEDALRLVVGVTDVIP